MVFRGMRPGAPARRGPGPQRLLWLKNNKVTLQCSSHFVPILFPLLYTHSTDSLLSALAHWLSFPPSSCPRARPLCSDVLDRRGGPAGARCGVLRCGAVLGRPGRNCVAEGNKGWRGLGRFGLHVLSPSVFWKVTARSAHPAQECGVGGRVPLSHAVKAPPSPPAPAGPVRRAQVVSLEPPRVRRCGCASWCGGEARPLLAAPCLPREVLSAGRQRCAVGSRAGVVTRGPVLISVVIIANRRGAHDRLALKLVGLIVSRSCHGRLWVYVRLKALGDCDAGALSAWPAGRVPCVRGVRVRGVIPAVVRPRGMV